MFDTHTHLNFSKYFSDLGSVIEKAREKGVLKIMVSGTDIENSLKAVRIANNFENVYCSVGIHPTNNLEEIDIEKDIFKIEEICDKSKKVKAIGEIGLDYYKYKSSRNTQMLFFERQFVLARKLGLSIIIHNRHATDDVIKITEKNYDNSLENKIVFHCATPDKKLLDFAKKFKIFLGFDGDITYDKEKQSFLKEVPQQNIVIETDSPFLLPQNLKKVEKFNTPKNLFYIFEKLCRIKRVKSDTFKSEVYNNSLTLFGINV